MEFDIKLYIQLSLLMGFEFAVWGAWCPVLAARCLGPLKMNGKQTGWIYATLPLASMITPLVAGWAADKHVNAEHLLAGCHLVGAVLLFIAVKQEKFWGLFASMFGWSLCFAATLPLVNTVLFATLKANPNCGFDAAKVFLWAPVAWALAGYLLAGVRNLRKREGNGSDCLVLAGILALAMFAICFVQPATPPSQAVAEKSVPLMEALRTLFANTDFAIFMLVTLVVAGMQQFYFLGSAQFMQDIKIPGKNVSAIMAIAQLVQTLATLFLLGWFFFGPLGPAWTLALGSACWAVLFLAYVRSKSAVVIVPVQAFHGLAYVFFIIAGQIYTNQVADESILSTAQGLIFFVQTGLSLFLCTQLAGFVMDKCSTDGKFQWSKIFAVPLVCAAIGAVVLVVGVKNELPANDDAGQPAAEVLEIEEVEVEGMKLNVTLPEEGTPDETGTE
ncbi:MAG: MFS transporter [Pirellulales bacterium]|nr:MFS transporter [Pirellulales bacterium]